MIEQVVKTDEKDKIISITGYWEIPLSTVKKMEEQQKEARARIEYMNLHSKKISDILMK